MPRCDASPTASECSNSGDWIGGRQCAYDDLDSDDTLMRSEHFYATATLPQTGLAVSTTALTISETKQTILTVTRHNGNNAAPLTVLLTDGDATELSLAAEVTIPAGQRSATTTVTALNDNLEDGTQTVSITASAAGYITGRTIVNVTDDSYVQIHGAKCADFDADGRRAVTEPGLSGWTIFVDLNQNGVLDATEPASTTDASGAYSFAGLRAGTFFVVELPQAGWGRTVPLSGSHRVTLSGGQAANTGDVR